MATIFRRRRVWLVVIAGFLVTVYVGGYTYLSGRGTAEAARVGMPYFFYCPLEDVVPYQDLPTQHRWAVVAFDPVNRLDRAWFGGGTPCRGVTWGFGGPPR